MEAKPLVAFPRSFMPPVDPLLGVAASTEDTVPVVLNAPPLLAVIVVNAPVPGVVAPILVKFAAAAVNVPVRVGLVRVGLALSTMSPVPVTALLRVTPP